MFELDPDNEFEAVLIAVAKTHREKSEIYGTEDDTLWNFYEAAQRLDCTPIDAMDALAAKHEAAWKRWKSGDRAQTNGSDDAAIDLAVYGIIRKVLYDRGAY